MGPIGAASTGMLLRVLTGEGGLPETAPVAASTAGVELQSEAEVVTQNIAAEVLERGAGARYPSIHIYCAGFKNTLKEKFRGFSGRAQMVAEVRVSQDRLDGLESLAAVYVDAVTQVLDRNRGEWGQGMFYCGAYEVSVGPVKHGGKNYLQTARIAFELEVSR